MKAFKVLVTDNVSQEGLDILTRDGAIQVDVRAGIKNQELAKVLGDYDAIITRSGTAVTAELLENPGKLKIIGRAGVGLGKQTLRVPRCELINFKGSEPVTRNLQLVTQCRLKWKR